MTLPKEWSGLICFSTGRGLRLTGCTTIEPNATPTETARKMDPNKFPLTLRPNSGVNNSLSSFGRGQDRHVMVPRFTWYKREEYAVVIVAGNECKSAAL